MMFGLKTAPAIMQIFDDFMPAFMQVFLDDFAVFSRMDHHLEHLRQCLQRCRDTHLKLNYAKCVFAESGGRLLRHLVSR